MSDLRLCMRWRSIATVCLTIGLAASEGLCADRLSDPTRPPEAARGIQPLLASPHEAVSLELSAIFFAEGRRVAIINGRRVRESDVISGARVVAIARDRVRLRQSSNDIELKLIDHAVKSLDASGPRILEASTPTRVDPPDRVAEGRPE